MSDPLALPYLVLAAVLALSGLAKLGDRRATQDMFVSLRVPVLPAGPTARLLPWAEVVLGAALLVLPAPAVIVPASLALLLFASYWALIARALTFDPPVSCACFGRLGGHRVTRATLLRNTILVGLAVSGVVASLRSVTVVEAVRDATAADVTWLLMAAATAALAALVARTDPEDVRAPSASGSTAAGEPLDYERVRIPYGAVEELDGTKHTLRGLAALQARLLVMLSHGCGSCVRTAQQLDAWAAEFKDVIAVHALYKSRPDEGDQLLHSRSLVLHEPDANVSRVFDSIATPQAVLLGTDGLLAGGPVVGEDEIMQLVDDLRAQLRGEPDADEPGEGGPAEGAPVDHVAHDHH